MHNVVESGTVAPVTVEPPASVPASTQVLIAGGGPVGLAAAVELGRRGIDCVVVEPRPSVSHARPRCKTVNVRTMEHLRRWGIAERLRDRAPLPVSWSNDVVFCTSLSGHELSRFHGVLGLAPDGDRYPELGQQAPQYVLEELLREVAGELDAVTLATGLRVGGLEQSAGEVRVAIDDADGPRAGVTADYVIGADGPRSVVRDAIGAAYVGEHALRPNLGMVFRAPELWSLVRHGPAVHYWIVNPVAPALMGPVDRTGTWWIIAFGVEEDRGRREGRAIIDGAAGAAVAAEVLSTDPWTARMQIVDRSRDRRVFLAGDAAHLNPPFGGHGLNTGVGDAVDLGWKLAAILDGWGGAALLDAYELERRPVQTRVIEAAVANMGVLAPELLSPALGDDGPAGERARRRADAQIQATKHAEFHALDLVLDIAYESPVIATGGARLRHAWLDEHRSLYDALGDGFALLVFDPGAGAAAIADAARRRGVPLRVVDLVGRGLHDRYGAALVLVRPDQHVAWAGDRAPADPSAVIDRLRGAPAPVPATTT
jgi:2-polyprenyl-6-methoxyphenol hydroxylase-like FAD-dependent oxidoreductase